MQTEQKRAFIIQVIYYLIWTAAFVLLLKYGLPLLTPFVLAFLIATLLHKPILYIAGKTHLPYKLVSILMVLLFFGTVGILIGLLIIRIFGSIQSLIDILPGIYNTNIVPAFMDVFENIESMISRMDKSLLSIIEGFDEQFMQWLGTFITKLSSWTVGTASGIATSIPGLFIKLVLMIISTFFIAADYDSLTGFCIRQLSRRSKDLFLQIKRYLVGTLFVCIGSYAIIVTLTFIELSIGFSIIGLEHAYLIALLIAIFDILPVLGTGGIMIPWAIIALLQGSVSLGLSLLLLYAVITVIRNIVEPKIVGSQLGLHPVVTLASMFAGVQLFGVIGLFGFPIGLSLLRYLNDNGSIHILKSAEEDSEVPSDSSKNKSNDSEAPSDGSEK